MNRPRVLLQVLGVRKEPASWAREGDPARLYTCLLLKPTPQLTTPMGLSHQGHALQFQGHLLHLSKIRKVTPLGRSRAGCASARNFTHSPGALGCQLSAQRQPLDFSRLRGSVSKHKVSFLCFSGVCFYGQRAVCSHSTVFERGQLLL